MNAVGLKAGHMPRIEARQAVPQGGIAVDRLGAQGAVLRLVLLHQPDLLETEFAPVIIGDEQDAIDVDDLIDVAFRVI